MQRPMCLQGLVRLVFSLHLFSLLLRGRNSILCEAAIGVVLDARNLVGGVNRNHGLLAVCDFGESRHFERLNNGVANSLWGSQWIQRSTNRQQVKKCDYDGFYKKRSHVAHNYEDSAEPRFML